MYSKYIGGQEYLNFLWNMISIFPTESGEVEVSDNYLCIFRILRNKIGSLSSHLHSQYPVKQSPTPSLPLANSSAAAMAYNSLYQHFPPYTPPISSPPPSVSNNNNNLTTNTSQSSCSPAKSEPGQEHSGHNSAVSSACFNKWPGR